MAIARISTRSPWRDFDLLSNRLGQLLDESRLMPATGAAWVPSVSVEETADELLLTAELPGVDEKDVEVEVENNILTLRGEKTEERREGEETRKYHLWERSYGTFARSFTLPRSVKADAIRADFDRGVLTVRMPKAAEAKSRKIAITSGNGSK